MPDIRVLDVVLTEQKPKSVGGWIVSNAIKLYQRVRGYPRGARRWTHTMVCVANGMLPQELVENALLDGRITPTKRFYYGLPGCWLLSVTSPVVEFIRYAELPQCPTAVTRLILCSGPFRPQSADIDVARGVAGRMIGLPYDKAQLLGLLINDVLGVPQTIYKRTLDFGRSLTVCSGGVATIFEAVRRKREDRNESAWERLFGAKHVERVCPADFYGSGMSGSFEVVWVSHPHRNDKA